jgi:hypothetical protein
MCSLTSSAELNNSRQEEMNNVEIAHRCCTRLFRWGQMASAGAENRAGLSR